jgi:hypothetical protein
MAEPSSPLQHPPATPRRPGSSARSRAGGAGDAVYGLGLIGALVYYWQDAASFWQYVLAVLKSLVWPALLVYDALRALKG